VPGTVSVRARSGLVVTLAPTADADVIVVAGNSRAIKGDISLSGGGAPAVRALAADLSTVADQITLSVGALNLADWTVGTQTVSADLTRLGVNQKEGAFIIKSGGRIGLSGTFVGVRLADTNLAVDVTAARTPAGWRIDMPKGRCFDIDTKGVVFGAITTDAFTLNACPVGGVVVKAGSRSPQGALKLSPLKIPFNTKSGDGTLVLNGGEVDWTTGKGLALDVRGAALTLPMTIGSQTLTIDGENPRVSIVSSKTGPKIDAALGRTLFSGTLIPARVMADQFAFDGFSGKSGVVGALSATGVNIRDTREDPIYQPLVGAFAGKLDRDRLTLSGPLKLAASQRSIAAVTLDLDVIKLDGDARVTGTDLAFSPSGLQPVMLSDRLRGVFTDAVGGMDAAAEIAIRAGKLSGTSTISVNDFGFQTQRLGRVVNIDGTVRFNDLFALSTDKNQRVTIGAMNPGLALTNGALAFDLQDGKTLHVENIDFPFAGGKLSLAPLDWTLGADQQSVEVTATRLDLSTLIDTLKIPKTKGTGTLSGAFPIRIDGQKILIDNARLIADSSGGRFAYSGTELRTVAGVEPVSQLAIDALGDLNFTVLELGLDGDLADRVRVSIRLLGRNVQPLPFGKTGTLGVGQPFEYKFGVDTDLGALLESTDFRKAQDRIFDAAVELIKPGESVAPIAPADPLSE
jgi:Dicarboxylate transport